jgi:nicotinate dehydrogenase subunit B
LAVNLNLHSDQPDNLLRTIFDGIQDPAFIDIGHVPAFRHALSDSQLVELAAYMRHRFAPDRPPWAALSEAVVRARASGGR